MTEEVLRNSFCSYPKIFALGHWGVEGIFETHCIVEEKIDGSQFSFGMFDGELRCRSKSVTINLFAPEKMFNKAVSTAKRLFDEKLLVEGWTYRGEYLQNPKHNTLIYSRTPNHYIMGFDISVGYEQYLSDEMKRTEFARIGLECVPKIFEGIVESPQKIREMLELPSILGGQKVEGVVIKNYSKLTKLGQMMIAKFVSEEFKELNHGDFKDRNPDHRTIIDKLVEQYKTPARWAKAVQHLKEEGKLLNDPKDIGPLLKEVSIDVLAECKEEIKDKLFEWAWGQIARGIGHGLPQWYKEQLMKQAFGEENGSN